MVMKNKEYKQLSKAVLSLTHWLYETGTLGEQDVRYMDKLLKKKKSWKKKRNQNLIKKHG